MADDTVGGAPPSPRTPFRPTHCQPQAGSREPQLPPSTSSRRTLKFDLAHIVRQPTAIARVTPHPAAVARRTLQEEQLFDVDCPALRIGAGLVKFNIRIRRLQFRQILNSPRSEMLLHFCAKNNRTQRFHRKFDISGFGLAELPCDAPFFLVPPFQRLVDRQYEVRVGASLNVGGSGSYETGWGRFI